MNLVDVARMLVCLASIAILIRTVEPDPTGGKGILPMRAVMMSWILVVLQAMQIASTMMALRDYGWTPTAVPDWIDIVNLVFAIIVLALVVRVYGNIRERIHGNNGKEGNDHDRYE